MKIELVGLGGIPEVAPGDDLAELILRAAEPAGVVFLDRDVLVVTQKIVSKAEGRVVPLGAGGKAALATGEARRVVARRGKLIITETRHGFVCAHAGVDESNVGEGFASLLPDDPDGSAERIRAKVAERTGANVGVVVTDTFGRAWRRGLVNVAIGCAGLPALVDLRGTKDALGRVLEVTVVALADEVAAAAGLVMGKADGVPVALVRGVQGEGPFLPASSLVRAADEDLFRESPLHAVASIGSPDAGFGPGEVSRDLLLEAASTALAALPASSPRALLVSVASPAARRRLRAALEKAGHHGAEALSDSEGPGLLVACLEMTPREGPGKAWLAGGALIQGLRVALRAVGLASHWQPSAHVPAEAVREALGVGDAWIPVGVVAIGPLPADLVAGEPAGHARASGDAPVRDV